MIEAIVEYLHNGHVPFRLASYPSEEAEPKLAYRIPEHGVLLDSRPVLLDGQPVLAGYAAGESIDMAALGESLGGVAAEGKEDELPNPLRRAAGPLPPLGQLFGIPTVLDVRVSECSVLVFRGFGEGDYFEVPYEDYARLVQPRLAAFASAGELPEGRSG